MVVRLQPENALRAIAAMQGLGFVPRAPVEAEAFADAAQREAWARDKQMRVFSWRHPEQPGFEVFLFVDEPFDFPSTFARGVHVTLSGVDIVVASIPDLIGLKRAAGRPQDLADIEALMALGDEEA